jgi:hypothetical protein
MLALTQISLVSRSRYLNMIIMPTDCANEDVRSLIVSLPSNGSPLGLKHVGKAVPVTGREGP